MRTDAIPPTGTCHLVTVGRRSGEPQRVELWYVVVDEEVVLTGTPGTRDWLANLRERPDAVLQLAERGDELAVTAAEVVAPGRRRRVVEEAWRLQPWYAEQPFSVEDWVADSPMVALTPTR
ncbi:nitroreductase/quinone reductase family protein [Isoptericola sp. b441]|uniref:Nitroreductase/quinone reductase family protein n=1 Tax=Actinotalea lenta TaxID=3064654 RepID=A0ABT9D7U1_9CELL|nr:MULTISPECIES: nitroreductase/quinone reductase family protein [unclassified Isoptericola]MDO8106922.1 nitroreductase/quinone reductase family protein [Isoptericola sp. b441]MDO8121367.1 nitroreductase/quinone reductase family protein [Isoptericola sp. b490]